MEVRSFLPAVLDDAAGFIQVGLAEFKLAPSLNGAGVSTVVSIDFPALDYQDRALIGLFKSTALDAEIKALALDDEGGFKDSIFSATQHWDCSVRFIDYRGIILPIVRGFEPAASEKALFILGASDELAERICTPCSGADGFEFFGAETTYLGGEGYASLRRSELPVLLGYCGDDEPTLFFSEEDEGRVELFNGRVVDHNGKLRVVLEIRNYSNVAGSYSFKVAVYA